MNVLRSSLVAAFLALLCFSLATWLDPWSISAQGDRDRSGSILQILLGDGRRLFANHFFAKADAYFHRGVYPSIFDAPRPQQDMHMVTLGQSNAPAAPPRKSPPPEGDEESPGSRSPDWIEQLNLHFTPSQHEHLSGGGAEREILPWLRLSAELDPQRVQTYTVAAYWLRTRLNKYDEAEQFLREGLRSNPDSPEILFELGQLYEQNRQDVSRARNLYELAMARWRKQDAAGQKPDPFVEQEILGHLARLEERAGSFPLALHYLEALRKISPNAALIENQIKELRARLKPTPPQPKPD